MSSKQTRAPILALKDRGAEENNASNITAFDLLWGMFGVAHAIEKEAEHGEVDVRSGLAAAARTISAMLVDRVSFDEYVEKPDVSRRRPGKQDWRATEVTADQQARFKALMAEIRETNEAAKKNPPAAPAAAPKPHRRRKANGAAHAEATA